MYLDDISWNTFADYNIRAPNVITLHSEKDILLISVHNRKLLSYNWNTGNQNIACTVPDKGNIYVSGIISHVNVIEILTLLMSVKGHISNMPIYGGSTIIIHDRHV